MKDKKNYVIIIAAILLIAVTVADALLVFRRTSVQAMETGKYQLEIIGGELESTLNEARSLTLQQAILAESLIDDKAALESFIYTKNEELAAGNAGFYNMYIAGTGWDIIPNFEHRDADFVATSRSWYEGAVRQNGNTYLSPPYLDVITGNICYTVSVMLDDGDTVIGLDYTMANIQAHIAHMYENGSRDAVIVTGEGIIAGSTDESVIGERLVDVLPQYSAVFSLIKANNDVVSHRVRSGLFYDSLFASTSNSGWYLIVRENDWDLYRNSYIQVFITSSFNLILLVIIALLYIRSVHTQKQTEALLSSKTEFLQGITNDLRSPLKKIIDNSTGFDIADKADIQERLTEIHSAGERLSDMLGQLISYSMIVRNEKNAKPRNTEKKEKKSGTLRMNKRFRALILCLMLFVMAVSLFAMITLSFRMGGLEMQNEVSSYEYRVSEWVNTQKSILDMFVSIISTEPEILDSYEGTISYLDSMTKQYPEISALYIANPSFEPCVYMNTGWKPDADWHVEERQWYIDTLAAKDKWSISAPYYDEQTGYYCVTISEQVLDVRTGRFLGIFGIDFYMDKLINILGDSYSDSGYAFLADAQGDIINHPYGSYQMSVMNKTNVSEMDYGTAAADGRTVELIRDYDGAYKLLVVKRNELSRFTVYEVTSVWKVYGSLIIFAVICSAAILICTVMVYRLLSDLIKWQDKVNVQMEEAAQTAIAAGQAKSRFLAQMSHEIRTPINAVLGMNEMILREAVDRDILEYSENIRTAGRTLLTLINSILDFSKIEDGKMEIIPVRYSTAAMINNLVNSISERAKAKGLKFEVNADGQLPCALIGDDVRVSQVIMNLLTNAVKYTENGCVTLTIKPNEMTDKNALIYVEVKDTGIGIKDEDMDRLFESFSRLDEQRNHNIEGTGLGMSIVTKLLTMMGSKLDVSSKYGEGSVFSFTIMQEIADKTPMSDFSSGIKSERHNDEKPRWNDIRVLVTDDNEMNLKVAKNLLKIYGINAELAVSGEETLRLMRKNRYDLVFLDHMMPGMDGIETLKKIKAENFGDGTPVIALTANAVAGAKEQYLEAGFDDYLSKPIEVDALEGKLIKFLHEPEKEDHKNEADAESTADYEVIEFSSDDDVMEFSDDEDIIEFSADDEVTEFVPETADKISDRSTLMKALEDMKISVSEGIGYCADDPDFYVQMLHDFTDSWKNRLDELEKAYSQKDAKNYRIFVHSLKSNAKTLGITDISEKALELENAARCEDMEFITAHHEEFAENLRRCAEQLRSLLDKENSYVG